MYLKCLKMFLNILREKWEIRVGKNTSGPATIHNSILVAATAPVYNFSNRQFDNSTHIQKVSK